MRSKGFTLAAVLATLMSGTAGAATITTLYNTGVDDAGNVLPDGSADPHYALVTVPPRGLRLRPHRGPSRLCPARSSRARRRHHPGFRRPLPPGVAGPGGAVSDQRTEGTSRASSPRASQPSWPPTLARPGPQFRTR
jgi:hypothetical protein